jgi:hypothetical protein
MLITLAAITGLAALAACAQVTAPQHPAGGATGRVILSVSAGADNAARTILPKEVPAFSRYELDFTGGGTPVANVPATPVEIASGLSQELDAGDWTVEVRAYRRFTPTGGSETEYLVARGSAPVTVSGGQITELIVNLQPVPLTDTTVKGIFTYTVSFPSSVSTATLTLTGGTTPTTKTLTSEATVSLELDPGSYDLVISLIYSFTETWTAGASEKVYIYSGLESEAAYTFTPEDFAQAIPLAGTVTLPGGVTVASGTIGVYSPSSNIESAAVPAGGTAWTVSVSAYYAGYTLSFKLDAFGSDGNIYAATGDTGGAVTEAGMRGITLTATQATPVSLDYNTWADGDITVAGTVDWYKITAAATTTYYLQWDDGYNSGGGKTLYAYVSAYRGDGTPIFTNNASGYANPEPISVSMGETVYVRVQGQGSDTGAYAVQYYDPATLPPQAAPDVIAQGIPLPACVVSWGSVDGATEYRVYRSTAAGGPYSFLETVSQEETYYYTYTYIDTTVTAGTAYYYTVSAKNGIGEGPLSDAVSDTPPAAGTDTPLSANAWTEGDMSAETQVDWYRIAIGTAGIYYLQGDDNYQGSGTYSGRIRVSAYRADGTPLFTNMGSGYTYPQVMYCNAGETLYVRVAPSDKWWSSGTGTYAIRYYDPTAVPLQAAPSQVMVRGTPAPACVITWFPIIGATGYRVYRSTVAGGPYSFLETAPDQETSSIYVYADTTVTAGTAYYYTVSATNVAGEGPQSDAVSNTPPAAGTDTPLTLGNWKEGDISVAGAVYWHRITIGTAETYYLQWDDRFEGSGDYNGGIWVSVYQADGTPLLIDFYNGLNHGYSNPPSMYCNAGETLYVCVKGFSTYTGTYAIRYYQ